MIRRQIVMPVSPERLWEALTEPGQLAKWFGADVEWDLREGGPARFRRDDGTERAGRIEAVRPGRHLRFRWWPAEPAASRPAGACGPGYDRPGEPEQDVESEISYLLEPIDEGTRTRLTVQERQIAENRQVGGSPPAQARGMATVGGPTSRSSGHRLVGVGRPLVRRLGRVQHNRVDGQARCPRLKARK